jgi:hypothetical protein
MVEFSDMRMQTSWVDLSGGDVYTQWSVWSVPARFTDADVEGLVREHLGAKYCSHEHDCCGNWYACKAQWDWHPHRAERGSRTVVFSRQYIRNV